MASRRAASVVVVCFALVGAAYGEPQPSREDFVRALMQQSRIVEDVHFQLPVEVYRLFLAEQAGTPQPAPVSHIVERGIYGVTLDADSRPVMRAELSIRVFDPSRCREIPVLSTALAWDTATVNSKPGSLAAKAGWLVLMPDKPGVYDIVATARLGRQWAKQARAMMNVQRSVRTAAKFDAAGDWHISAPGSTGLTASGAARAATAPAEAGTHVELAMPPTDRIDIAWTRPVKLPPRPPQFEVTGAIAWNIDAGRQQVAARMNVRFLGGPAERLALAIPPGALRCEITGPDVREMRVSGGTAEVFLRGKLTGQTRLNVSYELPAGPAGQGAGAVKPLPAPRLADGHWSGGTLVVTNTAGASELVADNVRSLREIYEGDIPADARAILAGKPVLAYEITARDFDAAVEVLDLGEFALQESIADLAHYQVLFRPDGSVMCKVDYEIRNRTSQFLRVHLPAGSKVLSARVNDVPTAMAPLAGEAGVSLLPLVRSKASVKGLVSFPVQIVLLYRSAALARRGLADVPLPTIDLPIAYGWCDLYAPEGMAVSQWSGPMRSVERLSSETAIATLGYGAGELAEGYREEKRIKIVTAPKPEAKPEPKKPTVGARLGAKFGPKAPEAPPVPPEPAPVVSKTPVIGGLFGGGGPVMDKRTLSPDKIIPPRPATQPARATTEYVVGAGSGRSYVLRNGPAQPTPQPAGTPPASLQSLLIELPTVVTVPQPITVPPPPKLPPTGPGRGGNLAGNYVDTNGDGIPDAQLHDTTVSLPDGGTLLLGGQIAGQSLLARNYYSAGKGYYEEGRYDQAAESLGNVARLAPGSVEAENAKRLLANIDVVQGKGQGKGKPASQQEKALGRQVQTEIAAQNVKLEQKQQAYIEQAGKVLKSGNLGEAQAAYKAAESLGEQLLAQGASKGEQDARLRQSRQEFAQLQQQQSGQVDQLRLQYEHFKSSGDVTKALAVGNALKGLVIEGEQKKALTGELEKLAIASVQHSDRVDRVEMAAKAEDVSSPQAGAYSYYGATRIRDLSSQMSVNAALPPVSDKPGTVVVDRSGSMTTDQPSGSRFTRWDGRRADEQDAFTNGPSPRLADTGKSDRTADESALSSRMELSDASARPMWTEELNRLQERLQSRTETETTNAPTGQPAPDFNYPYRLGPWARLGRWRQGEPSGGQMGDSTWDLSVRPRDVDVLKEKAKALRSQQKYDQALEMVEQVLLIDPSDAWAANEKQVLTEFSALKKDTAGFRTERTAELESQTALRDANTPWYEYIRYPRNWKQLAESRKEFQAQAAGETEADAAIREKLKPEIERLSFTDIDLRDVITFLREYSDANIHVNWRALAAAGIEQTTKVSVDVRKISVKRALDLVLLEASGSGASAGTDQELRYGIDGGVLTISTKADLAREPIRRVYDVRDLLTPVPDFEGPRTELRQPANAVFGTGGTGGGNGIFEQQRGGATGRGEGEMTKEKLMENFIAQIRNSVDQKSWGDDSTGPTAGTPGFVQILNGALVVTQTPENHQAVAEFIEKLRQAKAQQGRRPAARMGAMAEMRVYDIRDLVFGSDGNKMSAEEINRRAKDLADRVRQAIGSTEETWAGQRVAVDSRTNKLIVAAGPDERRRIEELLAKLREIRGPQVELGGNIAEQEAQGLVKTGAGTLSLTTNVVSYSGRTVVSAGTAVNTGGTFQDDIQVDSLAAAGAQAGHEAAKAQFEDFIRRNYDWQFTVGGTGAQDMAANINGAAMSNVAMTRMQAEVPILHGGWSQFNARSYDMWVENLAALSSNLGQSVVVNSSNIAVTPAEASQLGIQFQQGVNSLRYATVDEAQLRTLRQLEARQAAAGKAAPTNPRLQNTIVGTEALLSGGQRAYVARALSGSNTFDVAGNPIALPHEKYILLDAGGYITAAKASQMQHWTQPVAKEDVGFADVPQELDVPRVGNLVRFEKTLIRPADRLTIRAEYTWKGAVK